MKEVLISTKFFDFEKFSATMNGNNATFYRIKSSDSIVILPILPDGRVIIEKQYRPAIGKYIYELPAGHIDGKEKPVTAARRELEEETGYFANTMKLLFAAYPSPGMKTEFSSCYLATDLIKTKVHKEADEVIAIKKIKLKKLVSMIRNNRIVDAKTIAAVAFYITFSKPAL